MRLQAAARIIPSPSGAEHQQRSHPLRRCLCHDLHQQLVPYEQAWSWQKQLLKQRLTAIGPLPDAVLLLQHQPVYTLGTGSTTNNLRFDPAAPPHPLYRTERGGEVTYHGPGQLVMYPILDLKHQQPDLHWYMHSLEEVIIRTLLQAFGLRTSRQAGLTGVWCGGRKVAAIGVRARRWITYHGIALNVAADLRPFEQIVPCGVVGRGVTDVAQLLGQGSARADASLGQQLLDHAAQTLLQQLAEVFELDLVTSESPLDSTQQPSGTCLPPAHPIRQSDAFALDT